MYTELALRYLIDTVGVDRVVFGTDWPYDMALDWPVSWILSMTSLSQRGEERHPLEEPRAAAGNLTKTSGAPPRLPFAGFHR